MNDQEQCSKCQMRAECDWWHAATDQDVGRLVLLLVISERLGTTEMKLDDHYVRDLAAFGVAQGVLAPPAEHSLFMPYIRTAINTLAMVHAIETEGVSLPSESVN